MHRLSPEIVMCARDYVGRPYRKQGRSRESGVDCIGLVICVAHELDISGYETRAYGPRPVPREFKHHIIQAGCKQVPYAETASGDFVQMAMPRWPVHCGIIDDDEFGRWIIHAYMPAKKVVRDLLTGIDATVVSAWRFPEM